MDASSPFALLHSPLLLLTLLVPIFVSFLLFLTEKPGPSRSNGGARLPPSPWGIPVLGHLPLLGSLPHRKLRYGIDDDLTEVFAEFEELLGTATVGEFVPWLAWVDTLMGLDAKVARARKVMDGLLERVISDHRQRRLGRGRRLVGDGEDDHRDFVDVLLDVSEDDGEDSGGVRFDTVGIKAIILVRNVGATTI
ncbi:Cytochrome P450 71A26 [Triticum urartu]|uniref:Cytochrome P450 71A26 n=1 Tax=Triticum urartu TaxID=4572 RepID=M8A6K3_TRIUA|nr:Cytochrome P450 71A26 [Triticum urartu]